MKKIACLMFLAFFCIQNSHAKVKIGRNPCKTQANTIEINECANLKFELADRELNNAYVMIMHHFKISNQTDDTETRMANEDARKGLIEAQRAWIIFREKDCQAQYDLNRMGTIRGIVYLTCMIEHTEQRTKQLENWNAN